MCSICVIISVPSEKFVHLILVAGTIDTLSLT